MLQHFKRNPGVSVQFNLRWFGSVQAQPPNKWFIHLQIVLFKIFDFENYAKPNMQQSQSADILRILFLRGGVGIQNL